MQQVALDLVVEKDVKNRVENLLLDHILGGHGIFGLDDSLEELDHLDIGLNRIVLVAVSNLEQDLLAHEEHAQLV